jgi:UDP-N-acetylmuramoyl-L-alanyl-D-glutamate--2,6-diaminopimelate ligase
MKLSDILSDLHDIIVEGRDNIEITGIAYDSRMLAQGYVFVCIKGYKTDGHEYAGNALDMGACAIVTQKDVPVRKGITYVRVNDTRNALALMSAAYFGHPSRSLKLIGVTGTNGKTTTTYLVKSILDKGGKSTALLGTISNIICGQAIEAKRTTAESYDLEQMFSMMRNCRNEYCVMEVSSHSLVLNRVTGCRFNVGIFTNLTQDHLDFHENFDNYFNAKLKLFDQSKIASINKDDQYGREILSRISIPSVTYSILQNADVWADGIEVASSYSRFDIHYQGNSINIKLPLPGRFNIYNSLAAATACLIEDISLEVVKLGLEGVKSIPGRSELIDSRRGYTIIIDYAHTPDGLQNILTTAREYAKGRILTLFGCGGDRDRTKRPVMGEIAGRISHVCIITSDNPRSEDPMSIINEIIPGVKKSGGNYEIIPDRREAIKAVLSIARDNDVVVIAGKGHETYQVLKDKSIHFDEREIISEILEKEI